MVDNPTGPTPPARPSIVWIIRISITWFSRHSLGGRCVQHTLKIIQIEPVAFGNLTQLIKCCLLPAFLEIDNGLVNLLTEKL